MFVADVLAGSQIMGFMAIKFNRLGKSRSRPAWARGLKLVTQSEKPAILGRAPRGRVD